MSCILCVDDDRDTLKVRTLLLEAAGHSVRTADSGIKALQLLDELTGIDVVLLDYLMPGMNGQELAEKLRRLRPELPLIAISGVSLPPEFLNSIYRYVQKGQDPEVLLAAISMVLEVSKERSHNRPPFRGTVLCVEDEPLQLKRSRVLFESAGYSVLEAQSDRVAMELFKSQHIDAVVMDYWLSGNSGTTVAEEMKKLHPRIPILMFSGFPSLPGEGAIVDAWLRKADIDPEYLLHEVQRLIKLRRGNRESASS